MHHRAFSCAALTLALVCLVNFIPSAAATALQSDYTPIAGFPRTDPKGSIFFASPAVIDLDGDGRPEILTIDGDACVYGWHANGTTLPGFPLKTGADCRTMPRSTTQLAIGDLDGDHRMEIVAGTEGTGTADGERGKVFAWHADGSLLAGWPQEMAFNTAFATPSATPEVYSVALADLDGDGRLEVLGGTNNNASNGGVDDVDLAPNLYAWHADGTLLPGYPTQSRTAGIYGEIAAADLTEIGHAEAIAGRDHPFLHVSDQQGQPLSGWPVRVFVDAQSSDPTISPYVGFTHAAPVAGDLDGDGKVELVIAGKVTDPLANAVVGSALLVFEPDGTRRTGWEEARLGGPPLASKNYPHQAPALGDLNGDGRQEIVVATFDGHIRAYTAEGVQLWDYDYAGGKALFASEPVLGDIDGDGAVEVVFGTYSPDGRDMDAVGLVALHGDGRVVAGFPLPLPEEAGHVIQGIRAAPTLANLGCDGQTVILASSLGGNVYAWHTTATWNAAAMPWPTGRHDLTRAASIVPHPQTQAGATQLAAGYTIYLPLIRQASGC